MPCEGLIDVAIEPAVSLGPCLWLSCGSTFHILPFTSWWPHPELTPKAPEKDLAPQFTPAPGGLVGASD